jgi:hypothetical protein
LHSETISFFQPLSLGVSMNFIWLQRLCTSLILTAMAALGCGLSAQGQTINKSHSSSRPIPGTISTTATDLAPLPASNTSTDESDEVAQVDIDPGRPTRSVSSYIGIGGNIGLGGDSALGEGAFMVMSKIGLLPTVSVRPSVVVESEPVILIPVTYDFNLRTEDVFDDSVAFVPYIGAGIAIETSDDADVGLLLNGGLDVPLNESFTATAAVNAAFLDETDVGLMIGVGYNFTGF